MQLKFIAGFLQVVTIQKFIQWHLWKVDKTIICIKKIPFGHSISKLELYHMQPKSDALLTFGA